MISSHAADQKSDAKVLSPRSLDEVRALALVPFGGEAVSPLAPCHAVALAGSLADALQAAPDREALAQGLSTLPCPVLGLDQAFWAADLREACDVVVTSEASASAIFTNISRAPIAAAILVQVLRATGKLPVSDALKFESLAYGTLQGGGEFRAWLKGRKPAPAKRPADPGPPVLLDRSGDRLALRLNRPTAFNALSIELRDALCEALQFILADRTIETVSVSGAGRCFSVGGDLEEFGSLPDPATAHTIRSIRQPALLLSQCADRVEFAVHGACIGAGVELMAFGRRVVAARNGFFQLPEIGLGLIPGSGGCVSLPRRIGRHRTAYMALSARRITPVRALEWGLVDALSD